MDVCNASLLRRLRADRSLPRFEPCLPRPAKKGPPAGPGWIHEIKHDDFRTIARRDAAGVRLITRNGFDFADRFTLAAAAIAALPARSCVVDGEAIAVDDNGLSVFELIRYRRQDHAVTLCAFDLLELDGEDLRKQPIEERKRMLAKLLRRSHPGIAVNEHYEGRAIAGSRGRPPALRFSRRASEQRVSFLATTTCQAPRKFLPNAAYLNMPLPIGFDKTGRMVIPVGLPDAQQLVVADKDLNGRVRTKEIMRGTVLVARGLRPAYVPAFLINYRRHFQITPHTGAVYLRLTEICV
jgi:hypothetical protein